MEQTGIGHLAGGKPASAGDFILERRYRLVKRALGASLHGHLVDFGCGNGAQTEYFAGDFASITGLDVDRDFVLQFDQRMAAGPATARGIAYDGMAAPVDTGDADCIVSFEVLEHVEDEDASIQEIWRMLRPGGRIAISVPNRWWIFETHGAELPVLPWNRVPFFSWLPKRIHDRWARARIYRRREILRKISAAGFSIDQSAYITAPMDVIKFAPLRDLLRSTVFAADTTPVPFLATAILVVATKPA